jgi:HD-GYP domain-containing protein (c-di-GMP phosphodiesterase class II)
MLNNVDDVTRVIEEDQRFSRWSVRDRGDGYLEADRSGEILVLAWPLVWRDRFRLEPHLRRARSGNYTLLLMGSDDDFSSVEVTDILNASANIVPVVVPLPAARLELQLRTGGNTSELRRQTAALELELERARYENDLLISIGRALSQQRDIASLLGIILQKAREVSGADAGSVYVVEGDNDNVSENTLRFMVSQNDSVKMESKGFVMPISGESIVGTCVLSSDVINIPDLYALDEPGTGNNPWGFVHDRSFDDKHGYQTRSMLTVPMISARNNVIGVIQLINKRGRGVVTLTSAEDFDTGVTDFDKISINYAATLASQAGIALENALLYDEVRTLFEGFVRASVTAIESRDPTTSGHSERVADLTVGLAKAVEHVDTGSYANLVFTLDEIKQIEYAGLLHDFGKVGVREHVLVKAKKLYEHQRDIILQRFHYVRRTIELGQFRSKTTYLLEASREQVVEELAAVDTEAAAKLSQLDEFVRFILEANEPSILEKGGFERIAEIASQRYIDGEGVEQPYLTDPEAAALQVLKGSLTPEERLEIESHVVHTYNFLNQIPWGKAFRAVPEIAGAHHEKLNGKGYPSGLPAESIPPQSKMMTISDIFDALTASDRPYKKAMPTSKALDILGYEVKDGHLDAELYKLFLDAEIYKITKPNG